MCWTYLGLNFWCRSGILPAIRIDQDPSRFMHSVRHSSCLAFSIFAFCLSMIQLSHPPHFLEELSHLVPATNIWVPEVMQWKAQKKKQKEGESVRQLDSAASTERVILLFREWKIKAIVVQSICKTGPIYQGTSVFLSGWWIRECSRKTIKCVYFVRMKL